MEKNKLFKAIRTEKKDKRCNIYFNEKAIKSLFRSRKELYMGCHTWFCRPVTSAEFEMFRDNAIADAFYLFGNTEENKKFSCVNIDEYNRVKDSVENNTEYWWRYGFGTTIRNGSEEKSEYTYVIDGVMYLDLGRSINPIFSELKRYHDVFRIINYSSKIIHSRIELRKWMRKKYFDLEECQLGKVSEFFRNTPFGIIRFG